MNSYIVAGLAAKALRENREVAQHLAQLEDLRDNVDSQMLEIYSLINEVKRFETHDEYGKMARQLIHRWHIVEERGRATKNRRLSDRRSMSMCRNFDGRKSRAPWRENEGYDRSGRSAPRPNGFKPQLRNDSPLRDSRSKICESSVSILSTASECPVGYNAPLPRKGILKCYDVTPTNERGLTYRPNFTWKTPPRASESDGDLGMPLKRPQEKVIVIPPDKPPVTQEAPVRTGLSAEEWRKTFVQMKNLAGINPSSVLSPRDPRLNRGLHSENATPSASVTSETGYGAANRPVKQEPPYTPVNAPSSVSLTSENGYNSLNRPVKQTPLTGTNHTPSSSLASETGYGSSNLPTKQMPPRDFRNTTTPPSTNSKNNYGRFNRPMKRGSSNIEQVGAIKRGNTGGKSFNTNTWKENQNGPNFRIPANPASRPPVYDKQLGDNSGPVIPPPTNIGFKVPFVMPDTSRPPPPIPRSIKNFAPVKQYYDDVPKPTPPTTPVGVMPNRPNRTLAKKNIKMNATPPDSTLEMKQESDSDEEMSEGEIDDAKDAVLPKENSLKQVLRAPFKPQAPTISSLIVQKDPRTSVTTARPPFLPKICDRAPITDFKRIPKRQARPSVPRLFDLCEKACEKNARGGFYGRVPFSLISPLLEKYSAKALYEVEITMPWFEDDISAIWMKKLRIDFPAAKLFPGESYGQAYRRCVEELEDETTERLIRSVMEERMKPKIQCTKKAPVRRKRERKPTAPKQPTAPRQRAKRAPACT